MVILFYPDNNIHLLLIIYYNSLNLETYAARCTSYVNIYCIRNGTAN